MRRGAAIKGGLTIDFHERAASASSQASEAPLLPFPGLVESAPRERRSHVIGAGRREGRDVEHRLLEERAVARVPRRVARADYHDPFADAGRLHRPFEPLTD